jgi:hypothetical protein
MAIPNRPEAGKNMNDHEIRKSMTSEQIQLERKLTCDAIDGAIAFGYQNTNQPPSDDHWLAPFWKIGRKQAELETASSQGIEARRTADALRACDWSNTSIGTKAIVEQAAQLLYTASISKLAALAERCEYCDNTGDVHSIDGEWRSECTVCKTAAPSDDVIDLAVALEQQRALHIVATVRKQGFAKSADAIPTQAESVFDLACEEIEHRLRTEVWQLDGVDLPLPAAPAQSVEPDTTDGNCGRCWPHKCSCFTEADTGNAEADQILGRLMSSDPDFEDCTNAAALIRKLVAEHKGPDGFATWKDAAIAERMKRVAAAKPVLEIDVIESALQILQDVKAGDSDYWGKLDATIAALETILAAPHDKGASKPAAPEGFVLVPKIMTEHMRDEADFAMQNHVGGDYSESDAFDGWYEPVWAAIIAAGMRHAAAPAQSGEPVEVRERIARALHYPACWDVATYPTLESAAWEAIACAKLGCSQCETNPTAVVLDDERAAQSIDTGNAEADRIINRLSSSDPDFDDCVDAAAFIRKLITEHKGPDGFATWKDAAIAERMRRVKLEAATEEDCDTLRLAIGYIGSSDRTDRTEHVARLRAMLAATAQPAEQTAQSDDAHRYQLCRESAIERGLFETGEEYDQMVDSSLRKNGKEPLTGRGNNYGKKVAKDGSLYRPQPVEQTRALTCNSRKRGEYDWLRCCSPLGHAGEHCYVTDYAARPASGETE